MAYATRLEKHLRCRLRYAFKGDQYDVKIKSAHNNFNFAIKDLGQ
jgi:hypothetical protein